MADPMSQELLVRRFLDYASYNTQSSENSESCPSTPNQLELGRHLVNELRTLGAKDACLDENGYVTATIPDNGAPEAPVLGLIAHLDTSPDAPGGPVKARLVRTYDGGDIVLNEKENIVLSPTDYPELLRYRCGDILVTDGTTLLGADDKAGVTAIVSAAEYLLHHPEIRHGKIRIGITPDEEIGRGTSHFDVASFGADFAYTVDGGAIGGMEYENFNAANATITIKGRSSHTGDAKGKMKNAAGIAAEFQQMLPAGEKPEFTERYEGFFHVAHVTATTEEAEIMILVRDFDREGFARRKALLQQIADFLNVKYGEGTVTVDSHDVYYNMKEKITLVPQLVTLADEAMRKVGVKPVHAPIRGGTDGAVLTYRGLPCPNLFSGGENYHSRFEYLPVYSLQKAAETVLQIMQDAAEWER